MVGVCYVQFLLAEVTRVRFGKLFAAVSDSVRRRFDNVSTGRGEVYSAIGIDYRTSFADKRHRGNTKGHPSGVIEGNGDVGISFVLPPANKKFLKGRVVGLSFTSHTH